MKFYAMLSIILTLTTINTASASDAVITDNENYAYCNEQAQRENLVDEGEKADYIAECIEGLTASTSESGLQGEMEKQIQ